MLKSDDPKNDVFHEQILSKSCPRLLKIENKFFCQRTFLFVDEYQLEVCHNSFEYEYCVQGVDYLQQLIQFGIRSLEDILMLSKTQFCAPRSIDESLVTKWKHMIIQLSSFERDYLQRLLKRMIQAFL